MRLSLSSFGRDYLPDDVVHDVLLELLIIDLAILVLVAVLDEALPGFDGDLDTVHAEVITDASRKALAQLIPRDLPVLVIVKPIESDFQILLIQQLALVN